MSGSTGNLDPAGRPETFHQVEGPSGPITVAEQGDGATIVVVHGGSGDLTAWAEVATRLADDFRVLRYTRPLYRLDPPPTGARAVAAEVADALAVARWAGGPSLLVGHSSGAVVALETVRTEPVPFRGLALYEPPLDVTHTPAGADALRRARAALDGGSPTDAMRIHLTDLVGMPAEMVDRMLAVPAARGFFAGYAAGQIADNEMLDALPAGMDRFATIDLPVLLITGQTSPAHLHDRSRALAAALPDPPREVTLAGQSHVAQREAPDAVAVAVREFAATLSERPA